MRESRKHNICAKEARQKRGHTAQFHLYEVGAQAN